MDVKSRVLVLALLLAACSSGHHAASSSPTSDAPTRTTAESGAPLPLPLSRSREPSTTAEGRTTVQIASGSETAISVGPAGRTLAFAVPSCGGAPAARVEETSAAVHLLVTSDTRSHLLCLDALVVRLHRPLGARIVIDDKTGHQIATRLGYVR
jgi:hypothetical protein